MSYLLLDLDSHDVNFKLFTYLHRQILELDIRQKVRDEYELSLFAVYEYDAFPLRIFRVQNYFHGKPSEDLRILSSVVRW